MKNFRKIILLLICIVFIVCIAGCDAEEPAETKILIAYFSRTGENFASGGNIYLEVGNTAKMAGYIKDNLKNAVLFEIVPADPYPDSYEETKVRSTKEKNDNARPEIVNLAESFESYDVIFLGFPVWWGTVPMIIHTFLESYNFDGKTVVPFCTHGKGGFGKSVNDIKLSVLNANIAAGLELVGEQIDSGESKESVKSWLINLGYNVQ